MLEEENRVLGRVIWRLLPLLIVLYLVAYIDRQNVSFAKLQMLTSLQMSEVSYGFGASLFFIGYLIFEIPSNLALHKVGARRWIARIMLTWGVVTLALAWTSSATMVYILRFLLGAAEAGAESHRQHRRADVRPRRVPRRARPGFHPGLADFFNPHYRHPGARGMTRHAFPAA